MDIWNEFVLFVQDVKLNAPEKMFGDRHILILRD